VVYYILLKALSGEMNFLCEFAALVDWMESVGYNLWCLSSIVRRLALCFAKEELKSVIKVTV
jgi:hypothetical protein